jgi:hypothetical protein
MDHVFFLFYSGINKGFARAERASFLVSLFVVLLIGGMYMIVPVLLKMPITKPMLFVVIYVLIAFGVFIFNSHFYVKSGRYRVIKDRFGQPRSKSLSLLFTLLLIAASFIWFAVLGLLFSDFNERFLP